MELQTQGANFSPAFEVALGYVGASCLRTPVTGEEDLEGWYRVYCGLPAITILSRINEMLPIRTRVVNNLIKSFYMYRMSALNPVQVPLAINPETSLVDFFSLSAHFSRDVLDTISNEGEKITNLIVRLRPIVEELHKIRHDQPAEETAIGQRGDSFPK